VWRSFDGELTTLLHDKLKAGVSLVKGFTSDRIICAADENAILVNSTIPKLLIWKDLPLWRFSLKLGVPVAMLRVISDDSRHNLPQSHLCTHPGGCASTFTLSDRHDTTTPCRYPSDSGGDAGITSVTKRNNEAILSIDLLQKSNLF
jgi:hypothetical protein